MQTPHLETVSETLLDLFGIFHIARVQANKKTKHLSKDFESAQKQLDDKMEDRKEKGRLVQMAEAVMIHIDQEMDDAVKNLLRDVLKEVQDNRKNPLFLKYFPKGLREITEAKYEEEALKIEQILSLLENETAGKLKKDHHSILKNLLSEYKKAIVSEKTAQDNYTNSISAEKTEKLEWRTAYQKQAAELSLVFVGDKKMVDSFFKKVGKAKKKKGADAPANGGGEGA